MKHHKKKELSPASRFFTRGERVTAKNARRHGRKAGGESRPAEDAVLRKPYEDIVVA
jgi:hypothetical protein